MDIEGLRGVGTPATSHAPVPAPKPLEAKPPVVAILGNEGNGEKAPVKDVRPELNKALDSINRLMEQFGRSIRFDVQDDIDTVVALVVDRETGEVVRSIPSEEMINLMRRIDEAIGLFVDQAA